MMKPNKWVNVTQCSNQQKHIDKLKDLSFVIRVSYTKESRDRFMQKVKHLTVISYSQCKQ